MIAAKALLVSSSSQTRAASSVGVSQQRISQARTVLQYAPELVDGVIAGARKLDAAYPQTRAARHR